MMIPANKSPTLQRKKSRFLSENEIKTLQSKRKKQTKQSFMLVDDTVDDQDMKLSHILDMTEEKIDVKDLNKSHGKENHEGPEE